MRSQISLRFLFAILALMLLPMTVHAVEVEDDGVRYTLDESDLTATVRGTTTESSEITIKSEITYLGDTYIVDVIGITAFMGCSWLTDVRIPNTITTIGASAFKRCTGLTSIEIPNSVSVMWERVFEECTALTSVKLSESLTYLDTRIFSGCSSLASVEIPGSVKTIGQSAFLGCTNLKKLILRESSNKLDLTMSYLHECPIETAVIKRPYSGKLLNNSLQNLEIGGTIGGIQGNAYTNLLGLKEVIVSDSVATIGGNAFYGCSGLSKLSINSPLTDINGNAFYGCTALTELTIPSSVNEIGENAFSGCYSIKQLTLEDTKKEIRISSTSLSSCPIESAYVGRRYRGKIFNKNLESVVISDSIESIWNSAFSDLAGLKYVVISDSVTSIGENAFSGCIELTEINIPRSVTSIGQSAFSECIELTEITIPNSVTTIQKNAFYGCIGLKSITIPESVRNIGAGAFANCIHVEYVRSRATTPATIEATTFEGVYEKPLYVPEGTLDTYANVLSVNPWSKFRHISDGKRTVETVEDEMYVYHVDVSEREAYVAGLSNKDMTTITISERMLYSGDEGDFFCKIVGISARAFAGCVIDRINLPSSISIIGERAFESSTIRYVELPSSITEIGPYAFNKSYLREITIPEKVSRIEEGTFKDCASLGTVTLPENIDYIGDYAFGSSTLKEINFPNSIETIGDYAFYKTNIIFDTLPESLKYIGESAFSGIKFQKNKEYIETVHLPSKLEHIGKYAFAGCGFANVFIPSSVKYVGPGAFSNCEALLNVKFEDGFEPLTANLSLEDCNLYMGRNLTEGCWISAHSIEFGDQVLYIPASLVTSCDILKLGNSIRTIGKGAFMNCNIKQSIIFPGSLTSIGARAFKGCKLRSVTLPPNIESIEESTFENNELVKLGMGAKVKSIGDKAFAGNVNLDIVAITAITPPRAYNTSFSNYGSLYVTPGCKDDYYNSIPCWYRYTPSEMITAHTINFSGYDAHKVGKGESFKLTASLMPEDNTMPHIFWRSTDPEFATVSSDGFVTVHGGGSGSCKIIAETLYENCQKVEIPLTMEDSTPVEVPEAVDLGLSVDWSPYNLGASEPWENGSYYSWGASVPDSFSDDIPMVDSIAGTEYDAIHNTWHNGYHMPSHENFKELIEKCDWTVENQNGVLGFRVTGPNGNSIFIPLSGHCWSPFAVQGRGKSAYIWCADKVKYIGGNELRPYGLYLWAQNDDFKIDADGMLMNGTSGCSLRGVKDKNTGAIDNVTVEDDDANAPVEYYTLQGVRVSEPSTAGIYIVRQGKKVSKQYIR